MKKYVDLHCHPFLEYFANPDEIIENAKKNNIGILFLVGTDLKNSKEVIELSLKHNQVYPIIGIHPNDAWNVELINELEKLIDKNVVGIGEVGLDYHYDDSPSKEMQIQCFEKQIELAAKHNLPIIVHSRDAHEDTYQIIKKWKTKLPNLNFVLHSYSSGIEYVERYSKLNVYFSFSGVVTFKNAKDTQEAAKHVKLDLMFCETDTPYLTPEPHRGKQNLPDYVVHTTNFIANLKNVSIEEVLENINNNVKKVFSKIK